MSDKKGSLEKAMQIMRLLHHQDGFMGVSEISRKLGISKGSVHRLLTTLESQDFVQQNKETKKYWLGIELYVMGAMVGKKMLLKDIVAPYAKELNEKFGEIVNVSIPEKNIDHGPRSLLIYKEVNKYQSLAVYPLVGTSSECYCSAVGKCLMAFNDDIDFNAYHDAEMKPYTEHTMTHWADVEKECIEVKKNGYAIENEEKEYGLICIGVPIFNQSNELVAAISISGSVSRIDLNNVDKYVSELKNVAQKISRFI